MAIDVVCMQYVWGILFPGYILRVYCCVKYVVARQEYARKIINKQNLEHLPARTRASSIPHTSSSSASSPATLNNKMPAAVTNDAVVKHSTATSEGNPSKNIHLATTAHTSAESNDKFRKAAPFHCVWICVCVCGFVCVDVNVACVCA